MAAWWYRVICQAIIVGVVVLEIISLVKCDINKEEKVKLRDKTLKMFYHAYNSYMKYAYPADELMPLSCKGRYRGSEVDRGDIDEALGNFSLTLIDTLDTLAVIGNVTEFEKAVRLVIKDVKFDTDVVVSVFETNIRVLGGLLGGHVVSVALKKKNKGMAWYSGELLNMAVDIADRLLVAFNTTTGIPYSRVNLLYGIHHPMSRIVNEKDTCTACGGTMIMEFAALSRLTGNSIYEDKARKAMESIWHYRSRSSDLVGTVIDVHNGDWIRRDSGIGAGIDSYYEYCLKAYILLGDTSYLEKFNKHYAAINKYIRQGVMMLDVLMHQPDRPIRSFVDSLQAFWPGIQVLMGDLKPAIETHEMLYEVAKRHKFIPEAFTTNFDVYWSQHPLRPEFAESTYFLYEATKDPYYLEVGKHVVETLEEHAKVDCGFAAIKDLRTFAHEDKMDSYVLAETFKYLYLLFSEESDRMLDIHSFVFTTEAHLLPLTLGNVKLNERGERIVKNVSRVQQPSKIKIDTQSSCPNDAKDKFSMREFARIVRKGYRRPKPVSHMCVPASSDKKLEDSTLNSDPNRTPKLLAENFQIGNTEHTQLLKEMGITVILSNDGKIQLVHQAGTAQTADDASDGIKFMQDMIQISKSKGEQVSTLKPRIVQIMSPPFNGELYFGAGAAQFGLDISSHPGVEGEVVEISPYNACSDIVNREEMQDRIAIARRGDCMFIDKVRRAQKHGAKGVIIIDNNEQSTDGQTMFAMSGDSHSEDVKIPSVFLFRKDGDIVREHAKESIESRNLRMIVRLASARDQIKSSKLADSTESSTNSEEKREKQEEVSNDLPSTVPFDGPVEAGTSSDDKADLPSDSAGGVVKKPESDVLLDKMESSMEKKPSVFTYEDATVTSVKTESHIGRDEEGKLVKYQTTFSTFAHNGSSHVRITTKMIPFETNALEIDKANLNKEGIKDILGTASDVVGKESSRVEVDEHHKEEDQQGKALESERDTTVPVKGGDQNFADSAYVGERKRPMMDGVVDRAHVENEKPVDVAEGSIKGIDMKKAEKGDVGVLDDVKAEHSSGEQESLRGSVGQRKHPFETDESLNHRIKSLMDDNSRNKLDGKTNSESASTKPKNVICNAAGCFSSLEELDMFNELALQVRSNMERFDEFEKAAADGQAADGDTSLHHNEDADTEPENSESTPSLR